MKKTAIVFSILFWFVAFTSFAQNNLPAPATDYVQKHFPNSSISNSQVDYNEWDVYLDNGTKLEFTMDGAIKEIEGNGTPIPASVLPEKAAAYLQKNYPSQNIKEVEFERNKIEVDLDNGLEIEFDKEGNFLRIDD